MFGIDLASVDSPGQPDYAAAKAAGLGFVILRTAYGSYLDPFYASQAPIVKASSLPFGGYLFLRFPFRGVAPASPEIQALAFCQALGVTSLPPSIDLEFPGKGRMETGLTQAQALDWFKRAYDTIKAFFKISPIVYTSSRVWNEDLGNPKAVWMLESPLWLAQYAYPAKWAAKLDPNVFPPKIPYAQGDADNWWIHQYQGDSIHCPGFHTSTDLNRFNYLAKGAKSDRVSWVQKRLGIAQDRDFGPATDASVKEFQCAHGLTADGIIGPTTFAALAWVIV